jgi:hypothetical protein
MKTIAWLCSSVLWCSSAFAQMEAPEPFPFEDICAWVKVSPPIKFHGKTLEEIPDIREPILRLSNQLLSTGCDGQAYKRLTAFAAKYPENLHAKYVEARFEWGYAGLRASESVLLEVLSRDPGFLSAKVLLAGIRVHQGRYEDARKLLDEVEKQSPTDLWIFMNRLRLQAREKPSRALRRRLMEIVKSDEFPPNAREEAADLGISLPMQSNLELEEFMWARLDVKSNMDSCKIAALAKRLSEVGERFEETRKLLESNRAQLSGCLKFPETRLLLGQAYLMEAAKIAPGPSPQNEELIEKATIAIQADYPALRAYVEGRPQAGVLEPFLHYRPKPEVADADGHTPMCNAVRELQSERVLRLLNLGADPNGRCEGRSIMGHVMFVHANERAKERQTIVRALLSRDGEPTPDELTQCGMAKYGDCSKILLPIITRQTQ